MKTARRCLDRDPRLSGFFTISTNDTELITLTDAPGFLNAFSAFQRRHLNEDLLDIDAAIHRHPKQKRLLNLQQRLLRWSSLWLPCRRRLYFTALNVDTHNGGLKPSTDDDAMFYVLQKNWGQVFASRSTCANGCNRFFKNNLRPFPAVRPPNFRDFVRHTRAMRFVRSTCGPDGIPASALAAAKESTSRILFDIHCDMCATGIPPRHFNLSVTIFPVKKVKIDEQFEIIRDWNEHRPISMKNDDNKAIASVSNEVLMPSLHEWICSAQMGFVRGRNFLAIILEADVFMRLAACMINSPRAMLFLFDFCSAFPSMDHGFLFQVLEGAKFPCGFRNLVKAFYTNNATYGRQDGQFRFLFNVMRGVLQGCPLSSTLFIIAVNPFLEYLSSILNYGETVKACADDIMMIITSLDNMLKVSKAFHWFELVSGLRLNHSKCIGIPCVKRPSAAALDLARDLLIARVSAWAHFKLDWAGEYLGVYVGPRANKHQWIKQTAKYMERARQLITSERSVSTTSPLYKTLAVTTLSYLSQLCTPPKDVMRKEHTLINALLHFPPNTIPRLAIGSLGTVGIYGVAFLESYCYAALVRSSCKTLITYWPGLLNLWRSRVSEFLPASCLAAVLRGDYSTVLDSWDSPPFVETLKTAHDSAHGKEALLHLHKIEVISNLQKLIEHSSREKMTESFSWEHLLTRRLPRVFGSGGSPSQYMWPSSFTSLVDGLRRCKPIVAQSVLATLLNGWHTSHRMHEQIRLLCPFCFNQPDTLKHIVGCSKTFHVIRDIAAEHLRTHLAHTSISLDNCLFDAVRNDSYDLFYMCCFLCRQVFNALKFEAKYARFRILVESTDSTTSSLSDTSGSDSSPSSSDSSSLASSLEYCIAIQPSNTEVSAAVRNVGHAALLRLT